MCTAVGKYIKGMGWVIAKNRDQDYVSDISFLDKKHPKVGEVLALYDHDTGYSEGMNYAGLVVITTSLTPNLADETDKEDGKLIDKALTMSKPEDAAKFLISKKLTGFIFIASPEKFILVEAARTDDGEGEYHSKMRIVPKTETVVRTNHGVEFPWAGFQYGIDEKQDLWRKSSELRKEQAEKAIKKADNPIDLLDALASKMNNDLQMNLFRIEKKPRQMRTIFQWALIPARDIAYVRPIQCKLELKVSRDKIDIEVLENETIRKTFDGKVRHLSKIEVTKDNKEIKAVQKEEFLGFKAFITS
jgi:hypothetical protein